MNADGRIRGLPAPPDDRELPDQQRRRRELLSVLEADRPVARVPRWAVPRWTVPLAAGAAVAAIAVAAAALIPLVRGHAPAGGIRAGRTTAPATAPAPAAPCRASGGAECRQIQRFTGAAAATELIVHDPVGSVTVTGTSQTTVGVTQTLVYRGLPPDATRSYGKGVLTLGYRCRSNDCGVDYVITVPRSLTVQVVDGTGSIFLNALTGPIRATIDVGPVRGQNLASPTARFGTGVGAIDAAFAAAPAELVAQSDTGAVTLRVPGSASYAVTATAGVGQVSVTVPRSASSGHVIRAGSDVGPVTVTGG
ncbi:MAG TPA: hypothetical protein VMF87_25970 [Streptosporangiaceae bacterium]|nr:hypothetical protein [Streptosporangiaceae bacterium]